MSQPANELVAPGYAAYAQLVKMLLPSSGCLVIYAVDGDLTWCSNGYERPDFRELVDAFRKGESKAEPNLGRLSQTAQGVCALVARLSDDEGQPLGYVLIELGSAHSNAGNTMAVSLTRPLLSCLATQLALERPSALPAARSGRAGDGRLRLLLNVGSIDLAGPSAIRELLERCVSQLDCMSAVFCIPDQDLTEFADSTSPRDADARAQFEATRKHLMAWVQLNNRPMVVNGIENTKAPYKILSCPVIGRNGKACGLLALFRSEQGANFELDDVALIEILSRQAMTLASERQDALTGLLSRTAFERRIDGVLAAVPASPRGTLLYLDVAELAAVNAAFGFNAGDEAIRRTAQLIRMSLDAGESACRLSGDRFVVHMPDSDLKAAAKRGTELAKTARDLDYVAEDNRIPLALKFGVSLPPEEPVLGRHWIAAAEQACHEA